jgi:hypothetical protein
MTSSYLLRHGLRKYALLVVYECFPCSPKTAIRGHHVCVRASKTPKEKAEHNCVRASLHYIENRKWPICRVFEKTRRSVSYRLLKRIGRGVHCVFLFSKNFRCLLLMGARCTEYINFVTSIFSTTLITHFLSLFQNLSRADVWIFSTSPLTHILPTFHEVVHQEYHKATVLLISQKPYIFEKCSALSLCTKKCRMNWESSSLEGFYALVIREDLKYNSYKRMLCWKFPKT